jgi:hypothetical protein
MLQRLYAALISGPGINARPHNSRQRIDFIELRNLKSLDPSVMLQSLLSTPSRSVECPAKVPIFKRPDYPESEWSDQQKADNGAYDRQTKVLTKLRDIAEEATNYYNDHGEHALFLGFPILSLPAANDRLGSRSNRVLAPAVFVPVNLRVRRGAGAGVSLEAIGTGADLVQLNPALLAWIEQQTGASVDHLFADEAGEEPWREISEVISFLEKVVKLPTGTTFNADTPLQPTPRAEQLPDTPSLLPSAVLGLFPLANPGLLRDTKWMIENEPSLQNPVKAFLSADALAEPEADHLPKAQEWSHDTNTTKSSLRDFSQELLVTHADPCQAAAVTHARQSPALVIHGPPGTGKSQTIANVIGDHLARGEKVLFVCDKRTALDVVKYRLNGMNLGALCGVIHDPQRDRRHFYLELRERLENLPETPQIREVSKELALTNQRLNELHTELRRYFDCLQVQNGDGKSFHQLCGDWLSLRGSGDAELPDVEGLTVDLLYTHRTDAEEILRRSLKARWPDNPFRGLIGISLSQWLATTPGAIQDSLQNAIKCATHVDQFANEHLAALDNNFTAAEQAQSRKLLGERLGSAARRGLNDLAARLATEKNLTRWRTEFEALKEEGEHLGSSLDRELFLQVKDKLPSLAECNRSLHSLDEWQKISESWKRFFASGKKRLATETLTPFSLTLTPDNLNRARRFYVQLRARHLWSDLKDRVSGSAQGSLPSDDLLLQFRDGLPEILNILEAVEQPANSSVHGYTVSALANLAEQGEGFAANLQLSAKRAEAIDRLETALSHSGIFSTAGIQSLSQRWRSNGDAETVCQKFSEYVDTLDDIVRLLDRLNGMPGPIQQGLSAAAITGLSWEDAYPALQACTIAREIRRRLRENEALARIDTQRVEAAFSELLQRTTEKNALVRNSILNLWQERIRHRLLTSTGTRLNSAGASLRQRLFVKGQKSLKLRQMIAAGAEATDGDPLFDLCPVWMASPATVAQIFPRESFFDVVIFDEASQCRLEEALPVLLRAKRVVIAGDPKQLPPTRFFEQSLTESDDIGAETADQVFVQQQSEAEDLLSAALNLNVQEAFLDVHYRSRNEALIGFSNEAFYSSRLQPIPGHPRNKAFQAPIRLIRVNGSYNDRTNDAEAQAAANLVAELLDDKQPPSIGIACFNITQRDLILDKLEQKAAHDRGFAEKLDVARRRRGQDSFEGLFVRNLENVQGDERDHIIISTTFGLDAQGKFRRNFGALSRLGGERRLNVLVTRARQMIHVLTSIPRPEYVSPEPMESGQRPTGRHFLYSYLRYAERLEQVFEDWQKQIETAKRDAAAKCEIAATSQKSLVAEVLGKRLLKECNIGSTIYWGNDGFCVDVALTHPELPADVTIGVLTDFTRYIKTPDPIAWEHFRNQVLTSQGWNLQRVWTPALFREPESNITTIQKRHNQVAAESILKKKALEQAGTALDKEQS